MKIQAFVAEIFAKQYWRLFNPKFSMHFAYFHNLSIKVPKELNIFPNLANIFFNAKIKMGTY